MSLEVKIPPVGESISSGVIAAWHKKDGDLVQANEPLLTLETDKVSVEVPSPVAGKRRARQPIDSSRGGRASGVGRSA